MLNQFYYLNRTEDPDAPACRTAAEAGITLIHLLGSRTPIGTQQQPASAKLSLANGKWEVTMDQPNGTNDQSPETDHRPVSAKALLGRQYSPAGNFPFCLGLSGTDNEILAQASENLLFFFHPFYDNTSYGKSLFIFAREKKTDWLQASLENKFQRQRLDVDLIFVNDSNETMFQGRKVTIWDEKALDIAIAYSHYCLSAYHASDVFLLDGGAIGSSIAGLHWAEAYLRRQHRGFYDLAHEVRALQARIVELSHQNISYLEENTILKELVELSSRHDEVDYILRFYKNEYEILPLWYKRFGHIIKVLQGKRSFRSLYDKRAKKYKT